MSTIKEVNPPSQTPKASEAPKDVAATGTAPQEKQLSAEEIEKIQKDLKQGFSRLGNKEKELEKKAQELDYYVKALPELQKQAEELKELKQLLSTDVYSAAKRVQPNAANIQQQLAVGIMNDRPEVQAVQALAKEVQKLQAKLADNEKAETEREQARSRQAFLSQLEKVSEKFPVVHSSKSFSVVENMLAKLKQDGEEPDLEKAAKLAEDALKSEILKVLKAKAISKEEILAQLEEKIEAAKDAEEKPTPKNLSGAKDKVSTSPTAPSGSDSSKQKLPLTKEELRRRGPEILKRLLAEKNSKKTA